MSVLEVDPLGMLSELDDELDDELPMDGISILDDDEPKSKLEDDDEEPESVLGDGGDGSLGDNGNDPGPAAATCSGNEVAFATPAPIETEVNPRPVKITALTTWRFALVAGAILGDSVVLKGPVVLTVRLPVYPSDRE